MYTSTSAHHKHTIKVTSMTSLVLCGLHYPVPLQFSKLCSYMGYILKWFHINRKRPSAKKERKEINWNKTRHLVWYFNMRVTTSQTKFESECYTVTQECIESLIFKLLKRKKETKPFTNIYFTQTETNNDDTHTYMIHSVTQTWCAHNTHMYFHSHSHHG